MTSVLAGASKPEQLLDNLKALENTSFTDEELQSIDRICGIQAITHGPLIGSWVKHKGDNISYDFTAF